MANIAAEISIINIAWNSDINKLLEVASRGDLEIIRDQVNKGVSQLWECKSLKNLCYVVTRIDPGPELVIVAGAGSGLFEFAPSFIKVAKRSGATLRTHVKRKGLIKMWAKLGLNIDEYILRG